MVADTVLFCHTKKFKKTSQGHICLVPKRKADLKMIHTENDVLTNDELVVVRDFLRKLNHACLYIRNEHPRKFKVLGIHIKDILYYPKRVGHCGTLLR